jgi:muramoyltetrapeptide carboxypeptidase
MIPLDFFSVACKLVLNRIETDMPIILPQRLSPGDTIGLVSPSSAPLDSKAIDRSVAYFEKRGFKVKLGRHARRRWGFLAGHDRERATDLMQMFLDRHVKGIVCIRGGYGAARILPLLDYRTIQKNPKVLAGFSDITNFHCALLRHANLLTFQGPMTAHQLILQDYPQFSHDHFWRILTEPAPARSICAGYPLKTVSVVRRGQVSGELIGGNLTVLSHLIGTPFAPSYRGKILLLEDVDELPYRIDRMLTHLLNAGLLQQVAGVAVGVCQNCKDPRAQRSGEYRQSLEDVLRDRLLPLKVPVVIGFPFGHADHNATLPIGGRAVLDADHGDLIITHAAVS